MIDQLVAMATILMTWGLVAVAITGLGLGCRALVDPTQPRRADDLFIAFWTGLGACIALVQVWHLFMPVDGFAAGTVLCVGMACAVVAAVKAQSRRSGTAWCRVSPWLVATVSLFLVWMSNRATGPGDYGDSGGYHLAGIRWAAEYAIVPGVANLLDHLGFNNAVFLLHALCESAGWAGRSNHIVNALLIAVVGVEGVVAAWRLWQSGADGAAASDAFHAILLPAVVTAAVGREASSPMTDLGAGVMAAMALSGLLRLSVDDRSRGGAVALMATTCAAAAVCLKVTVAVVGLTVTLSVPYILRRRGWGWSAIALVTCVPGCLLVVPWCLRGVLMSGYPLFPLLVLPCAVEWRLDPERVLPIQVFASNSGMIWWGPVEGISARPVERTWSWLVAWFSKAAVRDPLTVVVPLLVAVAFGVWFAVRRVPGWKRTDRRAWLVAGMPVVASVVFWFVSCPAPRMGMWVMWSLAAFSGAMVLGAGGMCALGTRRALVASLLAIALVAVVHRTAWWMHYHRSTGRPALIDPFLRSVWMPPGPDHGLHPYPIADLVPRTNRWGVTVNMPRVGPATWWAPLPATYNDITNLRLRRPGDLAHGFVTDTGPSPPMAGSDSGAIDGPVTP